MSDSTQRFSDRVANYVRYRPGYPVEVLQVLRKEIGLEPAWVVADVGSGTGISSKLFLDHGNQVRAVEPNAAMREAAESMLGREPRFQSIVGTAEQMTLADRTIDLVVAGQAFHWFDRDRARREFLRILRPNGWVVLMWNARCADASPFLRGYESLLEEFGTDYRQVNHENISAEQFRGFFGAEGYQYRKLANVQVFDGAGLEGRLLSSSYVPGPSDPRCAPMLAALKRLFDEQQENGCVRFEYDCELYFGRPG